MIVLGIDPGTTQSAATLWDTESQKVGPHWYGENNDLLTHMAEVLGLFPPKKWDRPHMVAIEMVASYGMAVGKDTFETCYWVGRFAECAQQSAPSVSAKRVLRKDHVAMALCQNRTAKDANVVTALVDLLDPMREYGKYGKGTKKKPGPLYKIAKHNWSALAVAVVAGNGHFMDI